MPTIKKPPKRRSHRHKHNPFYSSKAWKRARALALMRQPMCKCGKPATTVDHIKSMRLEGGHPTDQNNLEPMCSSCHNSKSARDGNKVRKKQGKLYSRGCNRGRGNRDELNPRNRNGTN